jgi:hypothetical protein
MLALHRSARAQLTPLCCQQYPLPSWSLEGMGWPAFPTSRMSDNHVLLAVLSLIRSGHSERSISGKSTA